MIERRLSRMNDATKLTRDEQRALRVMAQVGDDRTLKGKKWDIVKFNLRLRGLIRRRVGDWRWVRR